MTRTRESREQVPVSEILMTRLENAGMLKSTPQAVLLSRFAYAISGRHLSGLQLAREWDRVIRPGNGYSEKLTEKLRHGFPDVLVAARLDSDIVKSAVMHDRKFHRSRALLRK